MKNRILSITLSLVLLLVLTACGTAQAEQPAAAPEPPQAQTTTPEPEPPETAAPQPVSDIVPAASVENPGTQEEADSLGDNGVGGEYADRGIEPGLEQQARAETLSLIFRLAYSENEDVTSSSFDEHLAKELDTLVELAGPISLELPADYVDLYTNWRINTHGMTFKQASVPQTAQPVQQQTQTAKPANSTSTQNQGTTQSQASPNADPDRALGGANGSQGENYNPRESLYAGMTEEEIQAALKQSMGETQFRFDGQ